MIKITNRILSPTAINTYLSCPHKFYLRYIEKHRTKPSIHLIRGLIVHKTLHEFHKNQPHVFKKLPVGMVTSALLSVFEKKWIEAQDRLNELGLSDEELKFFYDDSRQMLENFSHWFCESSIAPANRSEQKIFSNTLGAMGIVDAIHINDEKVTLIDYKTSKHAKITDEIMRQAALYALLYQDKFGIVPHSVGIHFLKEKGDPKPVYIDDELLEYGKILIESTREKTASTDKSSYPCTCGGYCERDFSRG